MFHHRALLIACAFAVCGAGQIAAQSVEVFGGYTVNRMKLQKELDATTMSGWNTSVTAYPTSRFGITADVAGSYAASHADPDTNVSQYSFMAGPQFRLFRKERLETSIRALFGAARGRIPEAGSQTTFAALFGSNFDINLNRKIALRFSPGIYLTQYAGLTQNNFRFSVGPVFRFGPN